jgi:hypothetical protein
MLSCMRNTIEHNFGVLKENSHMLQKILSFKPRSQKKIIVTCMALHNYI